LKKKKNTLNKEDLIHLEGSDIDEEAEDDLDV